MIKIDIKKVDGVTIVTLDGNLDTPSSNDFHTAMQTLFNEPEPNILVNCNNLGYISSSGLRTFMILQKSVNKNLGSMALEQLRPEVRKVFDMTGFSGIIKIKD